MKDKKSTYDPKYYSEEAKRERFHRLAAKRVDKAVNFLRLIGNTGNKNLYSYSEVEVNKIFGRLEKELIKIRGKFITETDRIRETESFNF